MKYGAFLVCMMMVMAGCSTAPKRPVEIRDLRAAAATQLELLNREADRGGYARALEIMRETRPLALACDDPRLVVATGLSLGNLLFFLGRVEESDAALAEARAAAEDSGDGELIAMCTIYRERQRLLKVLGTHDAAVAPEVRDRVRDAARAVKTDELAAALAFTVAGMAEKELRNYAAAEAAFRSALAVHEKGRYLEQAAYDWFLIASVRSLAGRYADALAALDAALDFDRRAENSHGIGSDWLARGEVYLKMGDADRARRSFYRAEVVFAASGAEDAARSARARTAAAAQPGPALPSGLAPRGGR